MMEISELFRVDIEQHVAKPCWSPDGRFLAISTHVGSTSIFDLDAKRIIRTLEGHAAEVAAVGWDPRSDLILTSAVDRSIRLWTLESGGSAPFELSGHTGPLHSVEWTDEGAFAVACSEDCVCALDGCCLLPGWTAEKQDALKKYTNFSAISCSHNSTYLLATSADNGCLLMLVSVLSGDVLDSIAMEQPIRSLSWSPSEDLLAVGAGNAIQMFPATQEGLLEPAQVSRHAHDVYALGFLGAGRLLAAFAERGLSVWDLKRLTEIVVFDGTIDALSDRRQDAAIAFHPEQPLLASVANSGTAVRILSVGL